MSEHPTTHDGLRAFLADLPQTHALYPDAQLFAAAPADEQAALLNQVIRLLGFGYRNLGILMAWEITLACAAHGKTGENPMTKNIKNFFFF